MEHFRTKDYAENIYQWCDAELCQILDRVTGEPERFIDGNSIGTIQEARIYVENRNGWEDRMIIVKLNCITANRI